MRAFLCWRLCFGMQINFKQFLLLVTGKLIPKVDAADGMPRPAIHRYAPVYILIFSWAARQVSRAL